MQFHKSPFELAIEDIQQLTSRASYTEEEMTVIADFIYDHQWKGLDVRLYSFDETELIQDGIAVLAAPQTTKGDFLIIKTMEKKGLLRGLKELYITYIGSMDQNGFMPSITFKSLPQALLGVTEVYKKLGAI